MMYRYSLFWMKKGTDHNEEVFLGDHFSEAYAIKEIETWIETCEDASARNRDNYTIRRIQE